MTFSSYLTNLIIPFNLCMTLVVIGLVLACSGCARPAAR